MQTFMMMYMHAPIKCRNAESRAFSLLASVCLYWLYTLTGWPDSPTPKWVRHQLKKRIEREYCVWW